MENGVLIYILGASGAVLVATALWFVTLRTVWRDTHTTANRRVR
jgi:hypothetical protein